MLNGQTNISIKTFTDKDSILVIKNLKKIENSISDKTELNKLGFEVIKILYKSNEQEFWISSITNFENVSVVVDSNIYNVSITEYNFFINSIIEKKMLQGYFDLKYIDSFFIDDNNKLYSVINTYNNKKYLFEDLKYDDKNLINKKLLQKLVLAKEDSSFTVNNITNKINNLKVVKVLDYKIYTYDSSYSILLNLEKTKSNSFNFLLGYQPESKTKLIYDIKFEFNNLFKRLIGFKLNLFKPQDNFQFLNFSLNYPYIQNTNFGLKTNMEIFKKDSFLVNSNIILGISYFLNLNSDFSISYISKSSKILEPTYVISDNKLKLKYLDFNEELLKFRYYYSSSIDDLYFIQKGILFESSFDIGNMKINKQERLLQIYLNDTAKYQNPYENHNYNEKTLYLQSKVINFAPLSKYFVLKSALNSSFIFSKNITEGQMFYFGGSINPRGFDDNFFVSPIVINSSIELEYYLKRNFYSYLFVDNALFKDISTKEFTLSSPFGLGIGFKIKTKNNVFNISGATGKYKDIDFGLDKLKFHIEYNYVF